MSTKLLKWLSAIVPLLALIGMTAVQARADLVLTSITGSCVSGPHVKNAQVTDWYVAQGGTYTFTFKDTDGSACNPLTVQSQFSIGGNTDLVITNNGGGNYTGTATLPTGIQCTGPIKYCGENSVTDGSGRAIHLVAFAFDGSCNPTGEICGNGTPPQITCPANIDVPCAAGKGEISQPVSYPDPTVTGGTAPYTIVCTPASGSQFPAGQTTTVNCTVTDAAGLTASCSFTVTIDECTGPSECIISGPPVACGGSTSTFTYNGSGSITSFTWSVTGDGTIQGSATGSSVTVVAGASGSYNVHLQIVDTNGAISQCDQPVVVNPSPTVTVTGPDAVCYGSPASVTATIASGTGPFTVIWSDGTNTVEHDNVAGPTDTFSENITSATTFTATVTDANGCSGSGQWTVNVNPLPTIVLTGGGDICLGGAGTTITATLTGTAPFTVVWSDGQTDTVNGTTDQRLVNPTSTTTYTAVVTDANGCVSATSNPVTVTVHSASICVKKFYDANANGLDDDGQIVGGLKVVLQPLDGSGNPVGSPTTQYTDGTTGITCFTGLALGQYQVSEIAPNSTWVNTTPTSYVVTVSDCVEYDRSFGDYCLTAGGGLTLGFWSNQNGQKIMTGVAGGSTLLPAVQSLLRSLNLRNANGTFLYTNSTTPPTTQTITYSKFRTWILNATATNMAYMLSAQLAATALDVNFAGLNGNSFDLCSGMTVNALISAAQTSLALHGYTVAAGPDRTYQEGLKNCLDKINNNGKLVPPTPCPFTSPY